MPFWKTIKNNKKGKILNGLNKRKFFHHKTIIPPKRAVLSASMTLEAALIIPLFVFFVVAFVYLINFINFQNRLNEVMYDVSRNLSKLEYVKEGGSSLPVAMAAVYTQIDAQVIEAAGIKGGYAGLTAIGTEFKGDIIDLEFTYVAEFPFDMIDIRSFICSQKIYIRKWIGDEDKGAEESEYSEKNILVYITENGTVYHTSRDCTHLRLSIREVSKDEINSLRNEGGGKYYSCELCGKGTGHTAYITDHGDCYHLNINCSGLKRMIISVPISEVAYMKKCSRCGG